MKIGVVKETIQGVKSKLEKIQLPSVADAPDQTEWLVDSLRGLDAAISQCNTLASEIDVWRAGNVKMVSERKQLQAEVAKLKAEMLKERTDRGEREVVPALDSREPGGGASSGGAFTSRSFSMSTPLPLLSKQYSPDTYREAFVEDPAMAATGLRRERPLYTSRTSSGHASPLGMPQGILPLTSSGLSSPAPSTIIEGDRQSLRSRATTDHGIVQGGSRSRSGRSSHRKDRQEKPNVFTAVGFGAGLIAGAVICATLGRIRNY